jgi:hypothetical protein
MKTSPTTEKGAAISPRNSPVKIPRNNPVNILKVKLILKRVRGRSQGLFVFGAPSKEYSNEHLQEYSIEWPDPLNSVCPLSAE